MRANDVDPRGVVVARARALVDVAERSVDPPCPAQDRGLLEIDPAPENVRLRIRATDGPADGDLVEGGTDEIRICVGLSDTIFEDGFESGSTSAWTITVP